MIALHSAQKLVGSPVLSIVEAVHAVEAARREALLEAAALAEAHATCGCDGKHGRCNTDDAPLAIAEEIMALAEKPASGGANDG